MTTQTGESSGPLVVGLRVSWMLSSIGKSSLKPALARFHRIDKHIDGLRAGIVHLKLSAEQGMRVERTTRERLNARHYKVFHVGRAIMAVKYG